MPDFQNEISALSSVANRFKEKKNNQSKFEAMAESDADLISVMPAWKCYVLSSFVPASLEKRTVRFL